MTMDHVVWHNKMDKILPKTKAYLSSLRLTYKNFFSYSNFFFMFTFQGTNVFLYF